MPVFAVLYHYDPNKQQARVDARPEHRAFLTSLLESGTLLAAGAWEDDGAPGGLLVARGESADAVAAAFDPDPYRHNGVIAQREIRQWAQLLGPWSS